MPVEHTANVLQVWARVADQAGRRFSVLIDLIPEAGVSDEEERTAREAAAALLGLP